MATFLRELKFLRQCEMRRAYKLLTFLNGTDTKKKFALQHINSYRIVVRHHDRGKMCPYHTVYVHHPGHTDLRKDSVLIFPKRAFFPQQYNVCI